MQRPNKVTFRLSDGERAHLRKLVEDSGYSQEAYLRSIIKGIIPAEKPPPDFHSMMRELHAIGNNLNQIAYKANRFGVIDSNRYEREVEKLSEKLIEIVRAVKEPRKM